MILLAVTLFPSLNVRAELLEAPGAGCGGGGGEEGGMNERGGGGGRRRGEERVLCWRRMGISPGVSWGQPGGHPPIKRPANNTPGFIRLIPTRVWT